jgi:hypothetical protein
VSKLCRRQGNGTKRVQYVEVDARQDFFLSTPKEAKTTWMFCLPQQKKKSVERRWKGAATNKSARNLVSTNHMGMRPSGDTQTFIKLNLRCIASDARLQCSLFFSFAPAGSYSFGDSEGLKLSTDSWVQGETNKSRKYYRRSRSRQESQSILRYPREDRAAREHPNQRRYPHRTETVRVPELLHPQTTENGKSRTDSKSARSRRHTQRTSCFARRATQSTRRGLEAARCHQGTDSNGLVDHSRFGPTRYGSAASQYGKKCWSRGRCSTQDEWRPVAGQDSRRGASHRAHSNLVAGSLDRSGRREF